MEIVCIYLRKVVHQIPLWGVAVDLITFAVERLLDWGVRSSYHSSLFPSQATEMNRLFLLQYIKPFPLISSHFTAPRHITQSMCFDCQGSLENHIRSRWTEQLVLHCRLGSLSMIWLGIMSPEGKRTLNQMLATRSLVWLISQNESPASSTQRKNNSTPSQADEQRNKENVSPGMLLQLLTKMQMLGGH